MRSVRVTIVATALAISALGAVAGCTTPATSSAPTPHPTRIVGVTVDTTAHLSTTIASLRQLHQPVWTRLVLDIDDAHPAALAHYPEAATKLARVGPVMAELADSSELKSISVGGMRRRARAYLRAMGSSVAVWEIGNEVNGDWTGARPAVARKTQAAFKVVNHAGAATALTLYENQGCGDGPHELIPVAWSRRYLPTAMRDHISDVLLSYYEPQCHGRRPSAAVWTQRFRALHRVFPNSRLGFGEIGMPRPATAATRDRARSIVRHYYGLRLPLPYYVGGEFYWYYAEDMVPWQHSSLWHALRQATARRRPSRLTTGRASRPATGCRPWSS
jgi:hypothetical protein